MKKTIVILLVSILSGTAIYMYLLPQKDICQPATASLNVDSADNKLSDLLGENAALKNKITHLEITNKKLLAEINSQTMPPPATLISSNNETSQSAHDFSEEVQKHHLTEEAGEKFNDYLSSFKSMSPKEINRDLKRKFEAETIDFPWADNHERRLQQLFTANENLSKFVPEGVTCKTTRCQIKIPISSIEESNEVMEGISQALTDTSLGMGEPMIITLPDPSAGFVDFYIARDRDVNLYQ